MKTALIAAICLVLPAHTQTVWTIGAFDKSSEEFQAEARSHNIFRVGQSDWRRDWPRFLSAGQTAEIQFPLPAKLAVNYTLTLSVLTWMPRIPALHLSVNGHNGTFFLHPKLNYTFGDGVFAFDPHYSISALKIAIPARFLRSGENWFLLEPVDDPPSPPDRPDISGIAWDALELTEEGSAEAISASVTPTIFYKSAGAELVEAIVRLDHLPPAGSVSLQIAEHRYDAPLKHAAEFGEQRLYFEVPEWNGETAATLTVNDGVLHPFQFHISPARKWKVMVVPHTHLDVGYTDYQGKVAETQARVLDQAAELIRDHPDFRFSMDGSWNLEQLLDTRSPRKRGEILDLIRQGKMAMPAQYCNLLTGYASLETLYRSLYFSKSFARRYGLPFAYANITDVPSYTGAYPSILSSAGVKYFVAASNNDRAPVFAHERWNAKSPFWWEGPDRSRILFWYSRHYEQVETLFGLPPVRDAVRESLPIYLEAFSTPDYKPDVALLYGTQVENTDLFPSTATFVPQWNAEFAYPHLEYCTFADFFAYIDKHYGDALPVYKGDGGPYWEDGAASDALYTAQDRENQNRALSAEVLSSAVHSFQPDLHAPESTMTDIWRNIVLFSEHTWTSWNSVSQPDHSETVDQLEVKDGRAVTARLEIRDVINRGMSQLADQIHVPAETLVVFNTLNWQRDALVEADLPENAALEDLASHRSVGYQVIKKREGFLRARFLAEGLPSVGYKCYKIRESNTAAEEALNSGLLFENVFYRVVLDPATGALRSIYDKQLHRELVDDRSPYRFGQYLYVSGGEDTSMIHPMSSLPKAHLTIDVSGDGGRAGGNRTPFGQSLHLHCRAKNTPHIDLEVLLFDHAKKIEFIYHVRKDAVTAKEAVYFAFPVAAQQPRFAYALQQGWIDPAQGVLKGGSLEWFTVQDWMAVRDDNATVAIVPLDAPLASFGDINRGDWPSGFQPKSATVFSYAMNNYWHTNYRAAQGGEFTFRYVLTSGATLDPASLSRLALESMRPLEVNHVVGQDKPGNPERPLPPDSASFLATDQPNVVMETWKDAEGGNGAVIRLRETSGKATTVHMRLPHAKIQSASLCDAVEDDLTPIPINAEGALEVPVGAYAVITMRIR